jgi:hypothetical protein
VAFLLLRVPSPSSPARVLSGRGPTYPGSLPSRDITGRRPLARGLPSPRFVPSSGFRNLSTVSSADKLCELVPSRSRVQGLAVQGLLSPRSRALSSRACCPLAVVPRAFTRESSASRPSSTRGRVVDGAGFSRPTARSPLRFSLLQVFNLRRCSGSPESSARSGSDAGPSRSTHFGRSQRLIGGGLGFSVSVEADLPELSSLPFESLASFSSG